ncbi:potassium transporter [Bacteroidia bacterium]|nr:potassium transporter [Bacteroidia bacterium]GHU81604.1 potassium transporter [Bacteroidia bacterium]GHV70619.1 potassium transporter [Bacteroidia bacterium]
MEGFGLNWKFIFRVGGLTLSLESLFIFITAGVSVYFEESPWAFIFSGIITLACGLAISLPTDIRHKIKLIGKRESYISVTLSWLLFAVFGSLPFFLSREIPSFTDAFFESTSGITTTGASILTDIDSLSKGVLFWRSLLQWLGGMGIIVFSLALFPLLGGEAAQLFDAEATGLVHDKFRPRVTQMAKRLWGIYFTLTAVLIALLVLVPMEPFDAVCHAFTTISTGGFSTKQLSVAYWDSAYLESILCVFMIFGAINFTLVYFFVKGKFKKFFEDEELRWFLSIIGIVSLFVAICLFFNGENNPLESIRYAGFQVISIFTTTGFMTNDFTQWGPFFWILFMFLMIICGCAGSTSGGMKTVRAVVLAKNTFSEFARLLNPRAIIPVRLNKHVLSFEIVQRLLAFAFLYIFIIFFSWGVLTLAGMSIVEAMGASVSAISNVGPGFGANGPSGSFAEISIFAKWYLSFLMIVGRLEIFTVLILFTPDFWKK